MKVLNTILAGIYLVIFFLGCSEGVAPSLEHVESSEVQQSEESSYTEISSDEIDSSSEGIIAEHSESSTNNSSIGDDSNESGELGSSSSEQHSSQGTDSLQASSSSVIVVSSSESSNAEPVIYNTLVVEAESYAEDGGTDGVKIIHADTAVGFFAGGDWMKFSAVEFGDTGMISITLKTSKEGVGEGIVEIRIDAVDGPVIGSYIPDVTGDWSGYREQTVAIESTTGPHDLFLKAIRFTDPGVCNIDKLTLSEEPVTAIPKILFVGNSYIYYWEMPEMLKHIAESQGVELDITRSTKGGSWWGAHLTNTDVGSADLINTGNFDYVILQNNSRSSVVDPTLFMNDGKSLIQLVKDAGSTPLLYMTWGRRTYNDPNGIDQDTISVMYKKLAEQENIEVVPVGEVWQEVRDVDSDLGYELFHTDGTHPSIKGSYFIASVFFKAFTGMATADVPAIMTIKSSVTDPTTLTSIDVAIDQGEADFMQGIIDEFNLGVNFNVQ